MDSEQRKSAIPQPIKLMRGAGSEFGAGVWGMGADENKTLLNILYGTQARRAWALGASLLGYLESGCWVWL